MIAGNTETIRKSTLFSSQLDEDEQQRDEIDFKMVTFSIGGKEYGVDIMKVKEIAKFENFTYVPNTQPFVTGVYNLRGDIISVIDMRILFGLPAERKPGGVPEDGLILRLERSLIGVVVDSIDRVVGISSESIQPPHPIFADVNIKYISGVVEHESRLYIILDVERIFGDESDDQPAATDAGATRAPAPEPSPEPSPVASEEDARRGSSPEMSGAASAGPAETAGMVAQTLHALSGFTMSDLNRSWVEARVEEWASLHGGRVQITTQEQVDEFLEPFASPYSGRFWESDYLNAIRALLPERTGHLVNVWNPGCGQGHEAYSLASLLRSVYPDARIKVWAGDSDLLNVSTAPNLVFDKRAIPDFYEPYVIEGSNGYGFRAAIKELILFEFSDVVHAAAEPPADVIVIRDLLSFLREADQRRVVAMIEAKAKESTLIVPGVHEDLSAFGGFVDVSQGAVRAFRIA
jgi:chemotaxis signal transduction protein/chemotaxis methyl-accepting protein methylase